MPKPASPDALAAWASACGVWQDAARDGLDLWLASWRAWHDYLTELGRAVGPANLLDAQTAWFADSFDYGSHAVADRLQDAGVSAPLLNDA